ncbi:unnamed protein product [Spirodela intermedia]|uniref:Uncharacterized protein n=1 Tax=Spirodela intermedia TaxID=51605 RepID=A0A7I8JDD9_SPIIN|nr:unnamed protein product [Spirodela intermedia]CAA6667755.1 unnamed protein product [Spirodela intermedia]
MGPPPFHHIYGEVRADLLLPPLLLLEFFQLPPAAAVYDVVELGAAADGSADSAPPLLRAWDLACRSPLPAAVHVPWGGSSSARSRSRGPAGAVAVKIDGTLVAAASHGGAAAVDPTPERWIVFDGVRGLSITGGTLDGSGAALWACKAARRSCPTGATSLTLSNSEDVVVAGVKSVDSELYHVVVHGCRRVKLQSLQIAAPASSPNTDGVHVQMSTAVTIYGAAIRTGDDCISVGPARPTSSSSESPAGRVTASGNRIGSLGKTYEEEGVTNVTVTWAVFAGSSNGLRIKSWARPVPDSLRESSSSTCSCGTSRTPSSLTRTTVPTPSPVLSRNALKNIFLSGFGVRISEVRFNDIRGSSATPVAVNFNCSRSSRCRDIFLQDVKLTFGDRPAKSSCSHVDGAASGVMSPPSCL